jgi:hypothetical protein
MSDNFLKLYDQLLRERGEASRLAMDALDLAIGVARTRRNLTRRRLEVIELRLRWRLTLSRNTVWSTIPEIRDAQEARRERLRERYAAVRFLRSCA